MPEKGEPLSERELSVLSAVAAGASNREIGQTLSISPHTVKAHMRNIFAKLGVNSRTEATTKALSLGLLDLHGNGAAGLPTSPVKPEAEFSTEATSAVEAVPDDDMETGRRQRLIGAIVLIVILALAVLLMQQYLDRTDLAATPQVTANPSLPGVQVGESRWFYAGEIPNSRSGSTFTGAGLKLYQIAGENEVGVVNLVDVYDSSTRSWSAGDPKPTAVADAAAVELFGQIYVIGGRLADGRATAVVEAYSPLEGVWRPVGAIPEPLYGAAAAVTDGQIVLTGGFGDNGIGQHSYGYDPGSEDWRTLADLPIPTAFASVGVIDGAVLVAGGEGEEGPLNDCQKLDFSRNEWSACGSLVAERAHAAGVVLGNKVFYVLGGGQDGEPQSGEMLDRDIGSWNPVELPLQNGQISWTISLATTIETRIYVATGSSEGGLGELYVFTPLIYRTYIQAIPRNG